MAKINLLPWREELRKERQRQFFSILGGAVLLTVVLEGYAWWHLNAKIDNQRSRVAYLQDVSKDYDKKIKEVKFIEEEERKLQKRIEVIETLQSSRPEIVKIFDSLVRTLPEGLFLTSVENRGKRISFVGMAGSNATVSSFMRNLDSSEWFTKPDLGSIESVRHDNRRMSKFDLQVKIPSALDDEAEKAALPPAKNKKGNNRKKRRKKGKG